MLKVVIDFRNAIFIKHFAHANVVVMSVNRIQKIENLNNLNKLDVLDLHGNEVQLKKEVTAITHITKYNIKLAFCYVQYVYRTNQGNIVFSLLSCSD